jgi:hypothetical protein
MTRFTFLVVASFLSAAIATPVLAQAVIQEPGAYAFHYPNGDLGIASTLSQRREAVDVGGGVAGASRCEEKHAPGSYQSKMRCFANSGPIQTARRSLLAAVALGMAASFLYPGTAYAPGISSGKVRGKAILCFMKPRSNQWTASASAAARRIGVSFS